MFVTIDSLTVNAKMADSSIDSELIPRIAVACGVSERDVLGYTIIRRSLDARKKPDVRILYRLSVELRDGAVPHNCKTDSPEKQLWRPPENGNGMQYPIIVGAGPAGLFAAYALALAGCRPVVLDRGCDVIRRKRDIDCFLRTRQLNPDSNYLYGEGGAGTWSDGKLYTRIHDPAAGFVLKTFADCGAQPEILYFSHPHIGSDRLPSVVAALREKIIALGGSFRWNARVEDVIVKNGRCTGVLLAGGEKLEAPAILLTTGHGSRNLIRNLTGHGAGFSMKNFQIGIRMEHPQEYINLLQYGVRAPYASLGAAEYNYCSRPAANGSVGGAVTFCMCPGGEIIPAVCDPERLCTNGMSESARAGAFANSALVTEVCGNRFPAPEQAFAFLDELERNVYRQGGSDYTAPAQTITDFIAGRSGKLPQKSSYRFGLHPARLDRLLPPEQRAALQRALGYFDRTMRGFAANGTLIGMETHVSSPVRFLRDPNTRSSSIPCLYIGGEGAGMAGGIVSAAVDGLNLAAAICSCKI